MLKNQYIPPNVLPEIKQRASFLLKQKWIRELILLPTTISGKRFSNKTADYGVFQPSLISHLEQMSIYVRDIERSRKWYESVAGLIHSRTCKEEPHPFKNGYTIKCCYMSTIHHPECLVLMEERDEKRNVTTPSGMSFFHFAFEVEGNKLSDLQKFTAQNNTSGYRQNYGIVRHNDVPPLGDGETGGNIAAYFYDPDYNNVEFFVEMDTIENYLERKK